jgi:hypothetical protein
MRRAGAALRPFQPAPEPQRRRGGSLYRRFHECNSQALARDGKRAPRLTICPWSLVAGPVLRLASLRTGAVTFACLSLWLARAHESYPSLVYQPDGDIRAARTRTNGEGAGD